MSFRLSLLSKRPVTASYPGLGHSMLATFFIALCLSLFWQIKQGLFLAHLFENILILRKIKDIPLSVVHRRQSTPPVHLVLCVLGWAYAEVTWCYLHCHFTWNNFIRCIYQSFLCSGSSHLLQVLGQHRICTSSGISKWWWMGREGLASGWHLPGCVSCLQWAAAQRQCSLAMPLGHLFVLLYTVLPTCSAQRVLCGFVGVLLNCLKFNSSLPIF